MVAYARRVGGDVEHRIQTVCLVIMTVIAVAGALYWLRPVMIPFILAVVVWLGLAASTEFQIRRLKVPRLMALPVTLVLGGVLLAGLGSLISASVGELAANSASYNQKFSQLLLRLTAVFPDQAGPVLEAVRVENLSKIAVSAVSGLLANTTNAVLTILSQSFLVALFVVFLALGAAGQRRSASGAWAEIERRIQSYIVIKAAISALTGIVVFAVLALLGVPLALVFGLFAFVLNFIPNVGSLIATLLPIPVVLGTPEISMTTAVLAIGLPAIIQGLVGNLIEPMLMGESLDLHPIAILLALIFWGMLWGIVGMLLATPITAMMKILLEQHEGSRPLADLLAGRVDALRSPEANVAD
jgi:AI-2 transport protein TqsA